MKTIIYLIVKLFLIHTILIICSSCILIFAEPEIHLIPKGYVGPIKIVFGAVNGKAKKYENGFRVYEMDEYGILYTQFKWNRGAFQPNKTRKYYYIGKDGSRQQIWNISDFFLNDRGKFDIPLDDYRVQIYDSPGRFTTSRPYDGVTGYFVCSKFDIEIARKINEIRDENRNVTGIEKLKLSLKRNSSGIKTSKRNKHRLRHHWLDLRNDCIHTDNCLKDVLQPEKYQQLDLSDNNFKSVPKEISSFVKLLNLDLSDNNLTSLNSEISKLKYLRSLDLGNNELSSLTKELGDLKNLESLILDSNSLENFPKEILELSKLKILSYYYNKLNNIPDGIDKLKELEYLILRTNNLKKLPKSLYKLKKLVWLDLHGNSLKNIPKGISKLSNLQILILKSNDLKDLPDDLGQLEKLKVLDLEANHLNRIPKIVLKLKNLKVLNIRNNNLPGSEIEIIKKNLPHCSIILEYY